MALRRKRPGSNWGGARPGAGRPKGSKNAVSSLPANQRARAAILARVYTEEAVEELVKLARSKKTPHTTRANIWFGLLERGYGKTPQGTDLGFEHRGFGLVLTQEQVARLTPKQQAQLEYLLSILAGESSPSENGETLGDDEEEKLFARTAGYIEHKRLAS
jgi:hypothetical protein